MDDVGIVLGYQLLQPLGEELRRTFPERVAQRPRPEANGHEGASRGRPVSSEDHRALTGGDQRPIEHAEDLLGAAGGVRSNGSQAVRDGEHARHRSLKSFR